MALIAQIALGVIIGGLTIALLVTGLFVSPEKTNVWLSDYLSLIIAVLVVVVVSSRKAL
jgi:hypothetical protein